MKRERKRIYHPSGGPMLTKQSERDATDVNLIMEAWTRGGAPLAGQLNTAQGAYGDFSRGVDYHEALDAVKDAERCFAGLPAKIRKHVDNDPGKYLDLVFDPERKEECVELGIFPAEKKVEPEAVVPPGDAKAPADVPSGAAGGGEAKRVDPAAGLFD